MWADMNSEKGRAIFSSLRAWLSATAPVHVEIERCFSVSPLDFLKEADCVGIERGCTVVKSFTCLVQLWRDLKETEARTDCLQKCVKAFRGSKLGPFDPFSCVSDALTIVIGMPVVWSEPLSKRPRV